MGLEPKQGGKLGEPMGRKLLISKGLIPLASPPFPQIVPEIVPRNSQCHLVSFTKPEEKENP